MSLSLNQASEAEMIGAFLGRNRGERWAQVFANPKGRKKLIDGLYHEKDIDSRCLTAIPHLERFAENVYKTLKDLGAPEVCHVISASSKLDGTNVLLLTALKDVVDSCDGTIICCIPGKLAYYQSEERNGQYILHA